MSFINDIKTTGFKPELVGKIATVNKTYIAANTSGATSIADSFWYSLKYEGSEDTYTKILNIPSLGDNRIFGGNDWALGTILGECTGNISAHGIEVKLFNPAWEPTGNVVWLVNIEERLVDLHNPDVKIKGRVWRDTSLRGTSIPAGDSYSDGSWTYNSATAPKMVHPGVGFGQCIDPGYLKFATNLIELDKKYFAPSIYNYFNVLTYNYAEIGYNIKPEIGNLLISNIYANSFRFDTAFYWGDSPYHWNELGGIVMSGVVVGTSTAPEIGGVGVSLREVGNKFGGTGRVSFSDLTENTTYYVRAFVERIIEGGTIVLYGEEKTIQTTGVLAPPVFQQLGIPAITNNSIKPCAMVSDAGEQEWVECGYVYSTTEVIPTVLNSTKKLLSNYSVKLDGYLSDFITGLNANTKYYIRAFITTTTATYYADVLNLAFYIANDPNYLKNKFINNSGVWEVVTAQAAGLAVVQSISTELVTNTTAQIIVYMLGNGGSAITEGGVVLSKTQNPTVADMKFISNQVTLNDIAIEIQGLEADTLYYMRGYAINSVGLAYGWERSFKTTRDAKLTNNEPTNITTSGVTLNALVDDQKVTSIKKQGFVLSRSNSTDASLVISIQNIVRYSDKTGNGIMSVPVTGLEANGALYYYRPFVAYTKDVLLSAVYGEISTFNTYKYVDKPLVELYKIESDGLNKKIKVQVNVISDGGATCTNFIAISDIQNGLTEIKPVGAIEITGGTGIKSYEIDMTGKATGIYYIRAYSQNSAGVGFSSLSSTDYTVVGQSMPKLGISTYVLPTGVQVGAWIFDSGNSTIVSKTLTLKNLSDNTSQVLTMTAATNGLSLFEYYNLLVSLSNSTNYEVELKVKTNYTEDYNENVDAVKNAYFTTPATWGSGYADKNISFELTKEVYVNETSNKPHVKLKITGDLEIGSKVMIVGRHTKNNYPTSTTISTDAVYSEVLTVDKELFYLNAELTKAGKYLFRGFYIENGVEYLSSLLEITVLSKDIISVPDDANPDDVNPDGEVNPSVFAPYILGNYDGREYYFGNKKWVWSSVDGGWMRDYTYVYTTARTQEQASSTYNVEQLNSQVKASAKKTNELTQDVSLKLDIIPNVGDRIDGFEVVSVFFNDDSDSDIFPYASYYGLLLVNFDAIELCNYHRAKEIADSLSAELMPIRKYPYILSFIHGRINYSPGEELWGDTEGDDEAAVYFADDDGITESYLLKTEERRAVPCRILVKDRYVTNLYNRVNEVEISLDWDDVNNQREVGVIERIKLTLIRKSDNAIVSSIESTVMFDDTICIAHTELTPSPVKIEYKVRCVLRRKPTQPLTHKVWIDSVSFFGGVGIISENDFRLKMSKL